MHIYQTFVFNYAKELVTVTYTKYNIILLNVEGAISKIIPLVEEFSTFYFEVGGTLNFVNRFFSSIKNLPKKGLRSQTEYIFGTLLFRTFYLGGT